jgi:hypothetical protein
MGKLAITAQPPMRRRFPSHETVVLIGILALLAVLGARVLRSRRS